LFSCQAKNGIQNRNVTGFQTCAIPISFIKKYGIEKFNEVTKKNKAKNPFDDMEALKSEKAKKIKSEPYYNKIIKNVLKKNLLSRSEERRVGKKTKNQKPRNDSDKDNIK